MIQITFITLHFVKNLLEYSDDYSRSVAKNSLWYLDTDATTANTNIGFEARKTLTKAARDDALNVGGKMLIQSSH